MLLILKQRRLARAGALKALDFATTRSPANCERFVDQYGLKIVFAMFMGKCKVWHSTVLCLFSAVLPFLNNSQLFAPRSHITRPPYIKTVGD